MGRSQLWLAIAIRLTGSAMWAGYILLASLAYFLGFGGSFPGFWIIVFLSLALGLLRIPLLLIGAKISPSDPWLDFWLDPLRFHKYLKLRVKTEPTEGAISASFTIDKPHVAGWTLGYGKSFVKIEDDHLWLEQPGKDLVLIELKTIDRIAPSAIRFDTGRWNYGKVTLFFDSASDADWVEEWVKGSVVEKSSIGRRLGGQLVGRVLRSWSLSSMNFSRFSQSLSCKSRSIVLKTCAV